MSVAVVIITAGRRDHLRRTLDGLGRQSLPPVEIVVVDMGAGAGDDSEGFDDVADVVGPPARRVVLPPAGAPHRGRACALPLAAARNAGAAATSAPQLLFLDVDCLPAPDLVASYADVLSSHPAALACGTVRALRHDWLRSPPPTGATSALDARSDSHPSRPALDHGVVSLGDDHELFWSLSFGVSRSTWHRIGGFDEGYVGYGAEDTDFAFRARRLGIRLAWFRGGTVYHQWHPPSRLDGDRTAEIVANARRFHATWGQWPMIGWLRELHELGRVSFDPGADQLELLAQPSS